MAQFQQGNPGGPGRPQGSKTREFLKLDFWLAYYHELLKCLPEEQRIPKCEAVLDKFFSKIQQLPGSPEDSKANATSALDELKAAEAYGISGNNGAAQTQPGSNGADVAARTTEG